MIYSNLNGCHLIGTIQPSLMLLSLPDKLFVNKYCEALNVPIFIENKYLSHLICVITNKLIS